MLQAPPVGNRQHEQARCSKKNTAEQNPTETTERGEGMHPGCTCGVVMLGVCASGIVPDPRSLQQLHFWVRGLTGGGCGGVGCVRLWHSTMVMCSVMLGMHLCSLPRGETRAHPDQVNGECIRFRAHTACR